MKNAENRIAKYLFALAWSSAAAAAAPIIGLGAIGDSLTDEYEEQVLYDHAESWTEQLVLYRAINMGPTAAAAGVGNWGEPRRTGYQYNWARYGDESADAIAHGQHTGIAAAATTGDLSHAAVFIGNNDFSPWIGEYDPIYDGSWSQADIDNHIAALTANWTTILDEVNGSGAKMVVCSIVDYSAAVSVWSWSGYSDAAKRDRVNAAVEQANDELRVLARDRRAVFLDMHGMVKAAFGENTNMRQYLPIGGVDIDLWQAEPFFGSDPQAGFVKDGTHPNTIIQGVLASAVLAALDIGYDTGVAPFTEAELCANAGLTYTGTDTLVGVIGGYADYITDYTCPADLTGDGVVDAGDLGVFITAYLSGDLLVDFTADGIVDAGDLGAFITLYLVGC